MKSKEERKKEVWRKYDKAHDVALKKFQELVLKAPKYACIVLDEEVDA